jgi:hypothetical protein
MTDRDLSPRADKAFAFAQETAKQLITLSTAILAVSITFLKDIAPKGTPGTTWLHVAWVLLLVSTAFGIAALMTLAGNLERPQDPGRDSIYSPNIKLCAGAQALLFMTGLVSAIVFGIKAT